MGGHLLAQPYRGDKTLAPPRAAAIAQRDADFGALRKSLHTYIAVVHGPCGYGFPQRQRQGGRISRTQVATDGGNSPAS